MASGFSPKRSMWAVLSAVLVLGATTARADGGGYQSDQGTHVFGHNWDDTPIPLDSARSQGIALQQVQLAAGQLKGYRRVLMGGLWVNVFVEGTGFIGVTFTATANNQQVTFTITNARQHTNVYDPSIVSQTTWEYLVTSTLSGTQSALCPNNAYALAIPGHWDGANFSFACLPGMDPTTNLLTGGGVAAKCVDWGYPPWVSPDQMPGGSATGPATTVTAARRYHAACTAMALADYCGAGISNTIKGTPILMFHSGNVNTDGTYILGGPFGSPPSDFSFEAAWAAEPVGPTGERFQGKALCLTKKRWTTLKFGGKCSATASLQDPRLPTSTAGHFCEELTKQELLNQGAVLFSYSAYIDAGLYRFTNPSNGRSLTTTKVTFDVGDPKKIIPAVAGASAYAGTGQPIFEGSVLTPKVQQLMPGFYNRLQSSLLPLQRYSNTSVNGSKYFLTLTQGMTPPNGYVLDVPNENEGFIYLGNSPPAAAPELHLWWNSLSYSHVTSTSIRGADIGLMGYLPELDGYNQL